MQKTFYSFKVSTYTLRKKALNLSVDVYFKFKSLNALISCTCNLLE